MQRENFFAPAKNHRLTVASTLPDTTRTVETELFVFLTPRVIYAEGDLEDATGDVRGALDIVTRGGYKLIVRGDLDPLEVRRIARNLPRSEMLPSLKIFLPRDTAIRHNDDVCPAETYWVAGDILGPSRMRGMPWSRQRIVLSLSLRRRAWKYLGTRVIDWPSVAAPGLLRF
jgi:hypothetical protein